MLRQVDDFSAACNHESTAKETHEITGSKLRLPKEDEDLFAHLGLISDFNGVDVKQNQTHMESSCSNHIDQMMRTHSWESASKLDNKHSCAPLRMDALNQFSSFLFLAELHVKHALEKTHLSKLEEAVHQHKSTQNQLQDELISKRQKLLLSDITTL